MTREGEPSKISKITIFPRPSVPWTRDTDDSDATGTSNISGYDTARGVFGDPHKKALCCFVSSTMFPLAPLALPRRHEA